MLGEMIIAIKGAGDIASGVAVRLRKSGFRKIFMLEVPQPVAVRRKVTFCEAVYEGQALVEDIRAIRVSETTELEAIWDAGNIAVLVDPQWNSLKQIKADVVVDAILAKTNLGTRKDEASLVIGLGPGFTVGKDVHRIVETKRGHDLGRVIENGSAIANTGIPGSVDGYTTERVVRSPADGIFTVYSSICDIVKPGDIIGRVAGENVNAEIAGVIRGLIRPDCKVTRGMKIGDIDPRADVRKCFSVSDKARSVGGGVLESILAMFCDNL
ncbi:selenium-dependent molybdenum cofactor biosynthesis protein YqeB [Desulforhopalus sp. IMCC35007]|uniref:selenium-dependent molybdenum cofactor biosynthesis protein YqeB n=1 Tax=Desulforhopalus sp. IMCC35007 TaxID=2569543 RepID=UPI001F0FBD0C|nr:selenium-dependent molybdenum cofactor biosynthesis protein YqeB [Desulforhopalus sp. IMCC35007]